MKKIFVFLISLVPLISAFLFFVWSLAEILDDGSGGGSNTMFAVWTIINMAIFIFALGLLIIDSIRHPSWTWIDAIFLILSVLVLIPAGVLVFWDLSIILR